MTYFYSVARHADAAFYIVFAFVDRVRNDSILPVEQLTALVIAEPMLVVTQYVVVCDLFLIHI